MVCKPKSSGIFFLLLFALFFYGLSVAQDTISPGRSVSDGQTLLSAGGVFELGFFSPSSESKNRYVGLWYKNIPDRRFFWVANRANPVNNSGGDLTLTAEGNLVIRDHSGGIAWSTNTTAAIAPLVRLLDSGNLVVTEADKVIWQSFDHPTDTLLAGMRIGKDFRKNIIRRLVAWTSSSDPSPGTMTYSLEHYSAPEIMMYDDTKPTCRSGPWSGRGYNGIPEMKTSDFLVFNVIVDRDEVSYTYNITNSLVVSTLLLTPQGELRRLVWMNNQWTRYYYYPKDQCDFYGECGIFGICNSDNSPLCKCLQGFEPRSPRDWDMRMGRGGCKRQTPLSCGQRDGFLKVSNVKVPDTSNVSVHSGLSLDECRDRCARNCSCTAYTVLSGGSGCINWIGDLIDIRQFGEGAGDDLYVRLEASDLGTSRKRKDRLVMFIAVTASILLLTICGAMVLLLKKKRKRVYQRNLRTESDIGKSIGKDLELPLFDVSIIETATDNFSNKNKLGEGGFGPVYKGQLDDGQDIAVKRLSKNSHQGLNEFNSEVMLIAKLQHRNLVRLLGCCIHADERMLVYEYMPNKSLDAFIFDKRQATILDWQKRLDIVLGIARGLLYLHHDSRLKIIHRDLKASNILLDKDMNPRISDFGMARLFKGDQNQEKTGKPVGTYGYMSPEYAMGGIFSVKSDVFSFGVIVLEILTGKKNRMTYIENEERSLLEHAWGLWKEDRCSELLDEALDGPRNETQLLRCMQVGLICVQEASKDRPTMLEVVIMLSSEDMVIPQPKRPAFYSTARFIKGDSSSSGSCSVNNITFTVPHGR